jgi:signal transduction histidine kinase
VELDLREQDLRPVVADVLALAADELSTRNVTLTSRMPGEPLIANVDADMLKQATLNVIENGAQAMPEGGRLDVVLEAEREGECPAQAARSALLRIADEGPGIADEIREKIFDLFFTTKAGGSGIGLAMTYRILQLHHGSVEVESKQGGGTRFLLRIPLCGAERNRRLPQPAHL